MKLRLAPLGVLLIAAAFLGYWALLVYCDVWRPSPLGVLYSFDAGRVTVVDVLSGTPAQQAGLRAGDRIAAVEGHPIAGRLDWMTVLANLDIGRTIELTVYRDGAVTTAAIVPELASWQSWRSQHGPELLVARIIQLVTLLLALLVATKRPRDARALVGAVFLGAIGVFSLMLPYRFASVWRALPPGVSVLLWVPFMSSVAITAWGFSFFMLFPRGRVRSPQAWCGIWAPLVPGLAGQGLYGYYTVVLGRPAPSSPWMQTLLVVGAAYGIAAAAALAVNYRRLTDVNERRRARVLVIGSVVGVIAGTSVVLSYWLPSTNNLDQSFLASPFAMLGTCLFLALPLSFAYAILRHRLFDIRVMIRQGLRHALARRAILALVPALVICLGIDLLAHRDEPVSNLVRTRLWIYITVAGVAVAARTHREGWLEALDRRFFRDRYNAQRLLRKVAEDVRHATNLGVVAPTVVSRIEAALHSTFVALLVRGDEGRSYRAVAASPAGSIPESWDVDNKVLVLASLLSKPLDIVGSETAWLARKMPVDDIRSIRAAAIELVVPVRSEDGDAPALFVLGPKRSEEPYTEDDGELLMAIAESLAVRLPAVDAVADAGVEGFEECPVCGGCYDVGTRRCPPDGATLVAVPAPRLLAGRYQLERRLGGGGMGTVYVAFDASLDRRVAVKLIRQDLAGLPGAAERFRREARAAAAFSHPNVVTVHDFGVVAGAHAFLVMELLDGRTLRETLRVEERIACERALAILRDVTAAVDAAHRRQIVHRDLKPENICLVPLGSGERATVLDFGLAKFLTPEDSNPPITNPTGGALLGTPFYMAPEQLRGEDADPSWDVWALAVIAFEMLSGSHPFAAVALPVRVGRRESASDPGFTHLTQACQQFFIRALAIDRAERPGSAAAFVAELEASLHA